ncbi:hypothetical protein CY0110_16107 [Crocosphaera chwakensis CCY0110]|uniref:Uncharacterized protein n=1 Tax=Crocosphaera chwakensis CCY0110 TaxID=391612 RepID=A3IHQ3_9CHRO|nr:hypothetical protein CY0110_16107 [Crocosphaera chwakensis CCY0110]
MGNRLKLEILTAKNISFTNSNYYRRTGRTKIKSRN